jgi:thiol:disulfide interchange protein DsbA
MNRLRRGLVVALIAGPAGWPAYGRPRQAGVDYTPLAPPQSVAAAEGRIEVTEFFWYGCPHCYRFKPLLNAWLARQGADVEHVRVPAVFNERWAHDAAIFYALQSLGLVERLHGPLFDAIHRDGLRTDNGAALGRWLTSRGADAARVVELMRSFGVQAKVRRAAHRGTAHRIEGTPAMAVHGRFTVNGNRGHEAMLETVDELLRRVREGRRG